MVRLSNRLSPPQGADNPFLRPQVREVIRQADRACEEHRKAVQPIWRQIRQVQEDSLRLTLAERKLDLAERRQQIERRRQKLASR